jgi:type II secretory pathway predicted ATPase ExeA
VYSARYRLRENPFGMTPDPRFFFRSASHQRSLRYLARSLFLRQGFLALTGEVGLGKTTVVRAFVRTFQPCLEVAFVLNTRVTFEEMLYLILRDFGCDPVGGSKVALLDQLNRFLIDLYADDRNPVLVIDEAQNLTPQVLEELRMLSNLETDREKLLQIVLVGQPELEELLGRRELRQLRQRIPGIHRLEPLTPQEVAEYVYFRLRVAGMPDGALRLRGDAVEELYRATEGIPRLINLIGDLVVAEAGRQGVEWIDGGMVRRAAASVLGADPRREAGGLRS